MERFWTISLAALGVVVAAALAGPGASASASSASEPAVCRAVIEPATRGDIYPSSPPATDTGFRVRCNKQINEFTFRTSRTLERVYDRTRLENPTPDDRIDCRSLSTSVGKCSGEANSETRVLGAFRVNGDPCGAERLRAQFRLSVSADCDTACTGEGYDPVVVRVEEPRGC